MGACSKYGFRKTEGETELLICPDTSHLHTYSRTLFFMAQLYSLKQGGKLLLLQQQWERTGGGLHMEAKMCDWDKNVHRESAMAMDHPRETRTCLPGQAPSTFWQILHILHILHIHTQPCWQFTQT